MYALLSISQEGMITRTKLSEEAISVLHSPNRNKTLAHVHVQPTGRNDHAFARDRLGGDLSGCESKRGWQPAGQGCGRNMARA